MQKTPIEGSAICSHVDGVTWRRLALRNVVTDPQSTSFALFHGFQLERHRFAVRVVDTVEHCRNVVAAIDAGQQQKTDLIYQSGLQEATIDVTSAFEQQRADPEVLA